MEFGSEYSENRTKIVELGALPLLVNLLQSGSDEAKENAAGALGSLARNSDNQTKIVEEGALPPLVNLLQSGSDEAKTNAAGALGNLADGISQNQRIKALQLLVSSLNGENPVDCSRVMKLIGIFGAKGGNYSLLSA